jgi:hypothetical protein
MIKSKKKFDAVKMMRDIRNKLHNEYAKDPAKRERDLKRIRREYMKRKTECV